MTTVCVPSPESVELLGQLPDGIDVLVWDGSGEPPDGVADVEFLVASYPASAMNADGIARMPRLRVIQLFSAGVEPWLPLVPPGVVLCNGRGIHGTSTAELAVAGLLSLLRGLPGFRDRQAEHDWTSEHTGDLDGKRVLVLGAGDIATHVADAVRVFGAQPTLVGRRARPGVAAIGELTGLLPDADIVVLALPSTDDTRGMVDARFLAALPDGAIVVNVARGPVVDTDALLAELSARRIYAFLDVTDPEPLPADHPLWDAPNLLITPHVGGGTHGWERRAYRLVREQLERLRAGEELRNTVTDGF